MKKFSAEEIKSDPLISHLISELLLRRCIIEQQVKKNLLGTLPSERTKKTQEALSALAVLLGLLQNSNHK